MQHESKCPKCSSKMEEGYATEHTTYHVITRVVIQHSWLPGAPALNRYGGIDEKRTDATKALPVTMFRCVKCGYLESFANPRDASG